MFGNGSEGGLRVEVSLDEWFQRRLQSLSVRDDTRAYLVALLKGMREAGDMSKDSLVLAYLAAIETGEFVRFQRIGDWVIWSATFVPESLAERELIISLGRRSYGACWRILRGKWVLYDELAERLPEISDEMRTLLR